MRCHFTYHASDCQHRYSWNWFEHHQDIIWAPFITVLKSFILPKLLQARFKGMKFNRIYAQLLTLANQRCWNLPPFLVFDMVPKFAKDLRRQGTWIHNIKNYIARKVTRGNLGTLHAFHIYMLLSVVMSYWLVILEGFSKYLCVFDGLRRNNLVCKHFRISSPLLSSTFNQGYSVKCWGEILFNYLSEV